MKARFPVHWHRYFWFVLALFAAPGLTALYRWTADLPRSDSPPKPISSPANAPPVADPEVCKEKARRFAAARAHVADCHDAGDCAASSALLSGDYDSTNCLEPLNPSRATPELKALAHDYHNACTRGCRMCRRTSPKVACVQGRCTEE